MFIKVSEKPNFLNNTFEEKVLKWNIKLYESGDLLCLRKRKRKMKNFLFIMNDKFMF